MGKVEYLEWATVMVKILMCQEAKHSNKLNRGDHSLADLSELAVIEI